MLWSWVLKWFIVFGSASLFITADYFAYRWSKGESNWLLVIVFLLGAIGYGGFALLCKYVPLGSTPMIGILVAGGAVCVGQIVFGESMTWQQRTGLVFVVLGFIFLNYHHPKQ